MRASCGPVVPSWRECHEMELLEMRVEQRRLLEHPIVVDGPSVWSGPYRERGVELLGEPEAVGTVENRVPIGPQHMGTDAGVRHGVALTIPAAAEGPPGGVDELTGVCRPAVGERRCR